MILRATLALLLIPIAALAQNIPQREMGNMMGECDTFGWNMKAEIEIAKKDPVQIRAAAAAGTLPELKLGVNNDVTLHPARNVTFPIRPEKDRSGPMTFSGIVALKVVDAGVYKLSSSDNIWIDVARGEQRVITAGFDQAGKCNAINKTVAYRLSAGDSLIIQINGSLNPFTNVIVTKWVD